jgi:hypothetical protein
VFEELPKRWLVMVGGVVVVGAGLLFVFVLGHASLSACQAVTADDVRSVVGPGSVSESAKSGPNSTCTYTVENAAVTDISVSVFSCSDWQRFSPVPVNGIGERAQLYSANALGFTSIFDVEEHGECLEIHATNGEAVDTSIEEALGRIAVQHLSS